MKLMDLSVYDNQTMKVKLLNGTIINVFKPTQKTVILISGLQRIDQNNKEEVEEALNRLVYIILNANEEGYEIDKAEVAGYSLTMKINIVNGYTSWLNELLENPT